MIIEVLVSLHRVDAQLAADRGFGEDIGLIMLIQHVVGDVLDDGCSFLVVDQGSRLDDELLGVVLELVKHHLLDPSQNRHNIFSGQLGLFHKLADQIILHAVAGSDSRLLAGCLGFCQPHGLARVQIFFGLDLVQHASSHGEADLADAELRVQRGNGLLHQLIGIKVHHIDRAGIDALPQGLELRHCQLVVIHRQLHVVGTRVFRHHGLGVVDGIQDLEDGCGELLHVLCHLNRVVGLVRIIFVRQCTSLVDIAVHTQIQPDLTCRIGGDNIGVAALVGNGPPLE